MVKAACAAAAAGRDLDAVEAAARRANEASRSLGVAFTGCTLPGAAEPLFTVPDGTYALGLGIHGEPGISSHEMTTAHEIAELLVDRLLAEEPVRGGGYTGRAAVLLNGLGATKYEELFVLYASVSRLLEARGLSIVAPVVGEQVTSLDMAGASLSLMFLDKDLEALWLAAADSPAFKTGALPADAHARARVVAAETSTVLTAGSPDSARQAAVAATLLDVMAATAVAEEAELGRLDSIAGDGDHGQGMVLGATAAARAAHEALDAGVGMATLFSQAGAAWAEGAGGTSGAAWGKAITTFGEALSDQEAADDDALIRAGVAAARAFETVGTARPGDKTMVDATRPFADELAAHAASGAALATAWREAAATATAHAERTADLVARKGRARTHGEASLGHPD